MLQKGNIFVNFPFAYQHSIVIYSKKHIYNVLL